MYVVSSWRKNYSAGRHRHIVSVNPDHVSFDITEVVYEKSDKMDYSVDIGRDVERGGEEILVVDSYEKAVAVIDDILVKARVPENRYKYYDVETGKINGLI